MKNKLIEKEYLIKIDLFKKYNQSYYSDSISIISDEEFDILKKEILEIERKYKSLKNKFSPSVSVGFKPSKNFKKVRHKVPMLSLGNVFNEEDLKNFEKKIINFLSLKEIDRINYSAEPKIDGISASLIYINGKFIKGLSRGDGLEAVSYTHLTLPTTPYV